MIQIETDFLCMSRIKKIGHLGHIYEKAFSYTFPAGN